MSSSKKIQEPAVELEDSEPQGVRESSEAEKLSAAQWVDNAELVFGRRPELVRMALGEGEYTKEEAEQKIADLLARPVS